jgi:actin related protein 2/3 complex subunit 3
MIGNMAVLPINTKIRGPAPQAGECEPFRGVTAYHTGIKIGETASRMSASHDTMLRTLADPSQPDIIEEALDLFRANCLFRNFEIKGE